MRHTLGALAAVAALVVGFQNCGRVEFAGIDSLPVSAVDVGEGVPDLPSKDPQVPATDPEGPEVPSTRSPVAQLPDQPDDSDGRKDDEDCDDKKDDKDSSKQADKSDDDDKKSDDDSVKQPTSQHAYVCVLKGSGKSLRLHASQGQLSSSTGTPREVCMSKNACLNIVSQVFEVKMAKSAGFCPDKNPHVVELNDDEILQLVGAQVAK